LILRATGNGIVSLLRFRDAFQEWMKTPFSGKGSDGQKEFGKLLRGPHE
jgi:hypothetical protein